MILIYIIRREQIIAIPKRKKKLGAGASSFAFLLVPSPLVEKRSDPYHGSVLPLNYEGSGIGFVKKSNGESIGKSFS